jgi:biotin carboxylase
METEARLRTDFNVAGPHTSDMAQFKRKSLMKAAFSRAGVRAARGQLCQNLGEALELLTEIGFPVVAKPDVGVGAANTFRIDNAEDLQRFFATKPPVEYLLEEFVEGVICTFDGLSDKDGNPVFIGSLQYSQGIMETVNEDRHIYFFTHREIPSDLEEAGRRLLKEFDIRERFFHIEFFRNPDGGLTALEVNVRPPGGPAVDVYNYACDVDLYWGWANVVLNNRFVDIYTRKYHGCYVGRKSSKTYRHTHDQIMLALGPLVVHHERIPVVFSTAMGDYTYILRTSDYGEMIAAAEFIQELA